MRAEGVEVVRRAITAKARTVNTAGAIVVRLAAAPVTMPKVFHLVITAESASEIENDIAFQLSQ